MRETKLVLLLIVIFSLSHSKAQSQGVLEGVMVKTYPIRYLYGVNGELTVTLKNRHQLSGMLQHHQRDWVSIREAYDPLGFSAIPLLIKSDGGSFFVSYQFPLNDEHFWLGPKLGGKKISAVHNYIDEMGDQRSVSISEQNSYLLCQVTLRNKLKGFVIEGYTHVGAVRMQTRDDVYREGEFRYTKEAITYLPHFLIGFSIGWGF